MQLSPTAGLLLPGSRCGGGGSPQLGSGLLGLSIACRWSQRCRDCGTAELGGLGGRAAGLIHFPAWLPKGRPAPGCSGQVLALPLLSG